ncbi:MAG: DUF3313 domain-containing protein [Deltaproteobacteria bacterium]|nr:DUF3313 domain-containing protein [Deltaproteobacteria bacterium]
MKKLSIVLVFMMLIAGCATMDSSKTTSAPGAQAGFLKGYYDRMTPGPKDGAKLRWIKPDVDWSRYNYVMLDSVVFFFDDDSEYKGINADELKSLADAFNKQLVDTLKDKYPIVTEPGIDVLRLRFAITDLKQSHPVLSGITTVVPVGLGISILKKGATGSWAGSGATSAEMMALDSMTNDVIAVAQDEKTAGFTERFSKWGSADEAFKFWAERVKLFLDQMHHVEN